MPNGVQVFVWCPSEAQAEQQKAAEEAEEAKLKASCSLEAMAEQQKAAEEAEEAKLKAISENQL